MDQFFLVLQTLLSHQELLAALGLHSLLADLLYQLLPSKQEKETIFTQAESINNIQGIHVGRQLQLVLGVQHFPKRNIITS